MTAPIEPMTMTAHEVLLREDHAECASIDRDMVAAGSLMSPSVCCTCDALATIDALRALVERQREVIAAAEPLTMSAGREYTDRCIAHRKHGETIHSDPLRRAHAEIDALRAALGKDGAR